MQEVFDATAEKGIDGIYLNFQRFLPLIGFEEPTVNTFIKKYGMDPRKNDGDWVTPWLEHAASFVTQFLRELKDSLAKVNAKSGKKCPVAVQFPCRWHITRNNFDCYIEGIDIFNWAKEGLVDIFAPCFDDCL